MISSVLTLITKAPYGQEDSFAGLRFALSQIAAGDLDKSDTILLEDGVYNAFKGHNSEAIGMPCNNEAVQDLMDLDGTVFCVKEDLEERGISQENVLEGLEFVSRQDVAGIVAGYEAFASF